MVEFATQGNEKPALDPSSGSSAGPSDIDDSAHGVVAPAREKKSSRRKRKLRSQDGADEGAEEGRADGKRRNSLHKAARDPRDEPEGKKRKKAKAEGSITRSPSPVIDFDGLSRPSKTASSLMP
jgi:GTP cyclohydrolase IA